MQLNENQLEQMFRQYCDEWNVTLSYAMPAGYEDACGTFDVTCNTLFLNRSFLLGSQHWKTAFYFFHELRHVQQYHAPCSFPDDIRESLPYVILYNGVCYKLQGNQWKMCQLSGWTFTDAYLSLPYELDANRYAYEMASKLFPEGTEALKELYTWFLPNNPVSREDLMAIFEAIENAVSEK